MTLRKIWYALLVICLTFHTFALASAKGKDSSNPHLPADLTKHLNGEGQRLLKTHGNHLGTLGYPEEMIKFLCPEEIVSIVENNYRFLVAESKYDLFIRYASATNTDDSFTLVVPLTASELTAYNHNRQAFIEQNAATLDVLFRFKDLSQLTVLSEQLGVMNSEFITMSNPTTYTPIDFSVLTTSVNVYDSSNPATSSIYKTIGFNFSWDGTKTRLWSLTDGLALSHTASALGYTNFIAKGGYYDGTAQSSIAINPEWTQHGIHAKFDILGRAPHDTYGRIWATIGNHQNAITPGFFTIYGQYAHAELFASFDISLGAGSITFTPKLGTILKLSTQAWQSNISSWYLP